MADILQNQKGARRLQGGRWDLGTAEKGPAVTDERLKGPCKL